VGELHQITVSNDGRFTCTEHIDNHRCRFDIAQLTADPYNPPRELDKAVWELVTSRIVINDSQLAKEFKHTWIQHPSLWHAPDRLLDYVHYNIRLDHIIAYMANNITPEIAHAWHTQTLYETHHIKIAEMFQKHRFRPGYVATLALQWTEPQWLEIERSLPFNENLPLQIIEYQEAGWSANDISRYLHALELADYTGQMELPPPPAFPRRLLVPPEPSVALAI
jgi:hypothetical protein